MRYEKSLNEWLEEIEARLRWVTPTPREHFTNDVLKNAWKVSHEQSNRKGAQPMEETRAQRSATRTSQLSSCGKRNRRDRQ